MSVVVSFGNYIFPSSHCMSILSYLSAIFPHVRTNGACPFLYLERYIPLLLLSFLLILFSLQKAPFTVEIRSINWQQYCLLSSLDSLLSLTLDELTPSEARICRIYLKLKWLAVTLLPKPSIENPFVLSRVGRGIDLSTEIWCGANDIPPWPRHLTVTWQRSLTAG